MLNVRTGVLLNGTNTTQNIDCSEQANYDKNFICFHKTCVEYILYALFLFIAY